MDKRKKEYVLWGAGVGFAYYLIIKNKFQTDFSTLQSSLGEGVSSTVGVDFGSMMVFVLIGIIVSLIAYKYAR